MKQLVVLAGCAVFLSGLAGCQKPAQTTPPISGVDPAPPRGGVEVIIEGGGEFPQFLAGTWKADKHGWEFVFEPDGTISSAVISLGRVRMKLGQVTEVPMKLGGKRLLSRCWIAPIAILRKRVLTTRTTSPALRTARGGTSSFIWKK